MMANARIMIWPMMTYTRFLVTLGQCSWNP